MKHPPNSVLALDIGSRTLLWVEAARQDNHIVWGESGSITLELGRLLAEPQLAATILPPTLDAIQTLGRSFTGKVDSMVGMLTGALRELPDIAGKLTTVGQENGMELRVITAEEEGELAWLGGADLFPNAIGALLDLGGHTAQLVTGGQGKITVLGSLPIGCQTLTYQFFHHDPPAQNEIAQLQAYLDNMLSKSGWHVNDDEPLAIAGGTAAAWASLTAGAATYRPDLIHGLTLTLADGEKLISRLSALSQQQIATFLKSDPGRAGVFLAGLIATVAVLRHLQRDNTIHTARSVRHGLAHKSLGI
jgi:exopolyphosphatase / guanosine-5'-triphosphate,3'-diphosphate pyrophosphatase